MVRLLVLATLLWSACLLMTTKVDAQVGWCDALEVTDKADIGCSEECLAGAGGCSHCDEMRTMAGSIASGSILAGSRIGQSILRSFGGMSALNSVDSEVALCDEIGLRRSKPATRLLNIPDIKMPEITGIAWPSRVTWPQLPNWPHQRDSCLTRLFSQTPSEASNQPIHTPYQAMEFYYYDRPYQHRQSTQQDGHVVTLRRQALNENMERHYQMRKAAGTPVVGDIDSLEFADQPSVIRTSATINQKKTIKR